jgi:drug/metabolite transporter (DMT)-like permease
MDASIALIVLTAAFFHATWNATVKSSSDHLLSITGINVAVGIIALGLLPLVGIPEPESWLYLLISAVLHFGYYIALSEAYKYGDFSQAYPVARGTAPIIVTLWGVFVLNEILSTVEIISLIGVLIGIMIFATRRFGQVVQDRRALTAALITSAFIGGYTLADGVGGRLSSNVPSYMVWLSILDCVPILIYAICKRGVKQVIAIRRDWIVLFFGGALALASYSMVVWSMTQAPIPLVSALRETSIIIAALIGSFYFKEPSGMRRIVASVLIFLSIALLAFD